MNVKLLHRSFAFLTFILAFCTYLLTVQDTVPFWDCGEFTAAAVQQQVPHPPGAPLFLMVGKTFDLLIPFGESAWRVNLVSVCASAVIALLLYLIIVLVINNFRGGLPREFTEALSVYGAGFVGACSLTFSDTFWFNAVESEVYAASTLFVALTVWLILRWHQAADEAGHERYLLLIAYLLGLSIGVHLLALLTIFPIAMIVYFRKYEFKPLTFIIMGAIAVAVFFVIYPGMVKWLPGMMDGHAPFKTEANEWMAVDSSLLRLFAYSILSAALVLFIWAYRRRSGLLTLVSACFILTVLGYSTYGHILLRANANPPMNENNPGDLSGLADYLGREQYPQAPFWPRRHDTRKQIQRNFDAYGEWQPPARKRVVRRDGMALSVVDYENSDINTQAELNYLLSYQADHMYWRYFAWNFIGRVGDIQDSPWVHPGADVDYWNYRVGLFADYFPINFFALPFLLGMLGLFYHARRDPKAAASFFILFILAGIIVALQQNQQNPQPRERDYFYTGSFMIFAMWIGIGVYYLAERARSINKRMALPMVAGVLLVSFIAAPASMAFQGWKVHDRSGNYMPFDYAYNILQSVDENAIVFTNGDNDTFPVWYMQDVAGVRRDVRIVNLSLGNTPWYVNQLKNSEPWGAPAIPLRFSDESIQVDDPNAREALSYYIDKARQVEVPVRREIMAQYTDDPALLQTPKMSWLFEGEEFNHGENEYVFRVQDQLIREIIEVIRFERPVYFSLSVGPDAYAGLQDHFRMEGMAMRVCPVPQHNRGDLYACNEEMMDRTIMNIIEGDEFFTDPHPGWKLRNLNNPDVYYDESNRRPISSYRNIYMNYANWLIARGNNDKAQQVLNTMNDYISTEMFPMPFAVELQTADMYLRAGGTEHAREFAEMALNSSEHLLNNRELWGTRELYTYSYNPMQIAAEAVTILGRYDEAMQYWRDYGASIGRADDPGLRAIIDQLRIERHTAEGDVIAAIAEIQKIISEYRASGSAYLNGIVSQLEQHLRQLQLQFKAGLPGDSAAGMSTPDA